MAYKPNNLSALVYANGFTLWHYKTSDTKDDVFEAGYFNDAGSMLRVGDMININVEKDDRPRTGCVAVVSSGDMVLITDRPW